MMGSFDPDMYLMTLESRLHHMTMRYDPATMDLLFIVLYYEELRTMASKEEAVGAIPGHLAHVCDMAGISPVGRSIGLVAIEATKNAARENLLVRIERDRLRRKVGIMNDKDMDAEIQKVMEGTP